MDAAVWREFAAADREWSQGRDAFSNELSFPDTAPEEGIEVIVGKNAVQIGESIHRLASGVPEVTSAILHDLHPAVIELQLYYPGGGHGASGVPRAPSRSALRFPVGTGAWKEAGGVVAHYRGDSPREANFFHGKGDGTDPEDLTRCYNCGYETYRLMSHCPECGRSMQSRRWSRRYGWILLVIGIFITAVMSVVLLAIGPALFGAGGGALRFSGSAGQARLVLGILGAVEFFGITAICYGLWQIVTGRRSKWVIYFAVGLAVAMGLVAVFL